MAKIKFELMIDTENGNFSVVNTETGEIKSVSFKEAKKPVKKTKKEESSSPELVLEDNKYCLNTAAVELMGISPDDKLDIKYEKNGNVMIPVIGSDSAFGTKGGNKVTKSNTVACRGSKNEELSKYGKIFKITPHATKEGLFVLTGDTTPVEAPIGDIVVEKSDEDLPLDVDILALVDDKDANIEEIDPSYFQL